MTDKLKPCPFCGGDNIKINCHKRLESPTGEIWSMCCYACGATFPNRYIKSLLVEAWNKRDDSIAADDELLMDLIGRGIGITKTGLNEAGEVITERIDPKEFFQQPDSIEIFQNCIKADAIEEMLIKHKEYWNSWGDQRLAAWAWDYIKELRGKT